DNTAISDLNVKLKNADPNATASDPNSAQSIQAQIDKTTADRDSLVSQKTDKEAAKAAALQKVQRAKTVQANADYVYALEGSIVNNMKTLSGLGVSKVGNGHYMLGGADYYPTTQAANTSAVKDSDAPIPAGQAAGAGNDWAA